MSDTSMQVHKYKVGQTVRLHLGLLKTTISSGDHEVVRLLPSEDNDHQYRVRDLRDRRERVVRESQLK